MATEGRRISHGGDEYTEAQLIEILKDAPTKYNVHKHALLLGRSQDAIKIVYRCAAGEMVRGTGWSKVYKIAKQMGWMQLAKGKGPK